MCYQITTQKATCGPFQNIIACFTLGHERQNVIGPGGVPDVPYMPSCKMTVTNASVCLAVGSCLSILSLILL